MLSEGNVATPAIAANVRVPDKVPPAGLNASVTVTLPAKPVAVLPRESNAVTRTAGLMVAPVVVVLGGAVTASWVAAPGAMVQPALVLLARSGVVAASVYPSPALSMLRVEKVATPATAAMVRVPESVPPAGFVPIATVTLPVKPGTRLSIASRAVSCTPGAIVVPAATELGCTVKESRTGRPAVMANAVLVAPERPSAVAASV